MYSTTILHSSNCKIANAAENANAADAAATIASL